MINENVVKIPLGEMSSTPSSDLIGIDMGQTLTKIGYFQKRNLYLVSYPTQKSEISIRDIIDSRKSSDITLNFTGGKSFHLYKEYSSRFNSKLIDEFDAHAKGISILHTVEKKKELPPSIVVTIGTGTSVVTIKEKVERLGGTAIGGGFFMGLIKILFDVNDFQEAINLAEIGTRYSVDLKVSDIYDKDDARVDLLFREFTAASLGKIDQRFNIRNVKKEDFINSLICMIGENIGTIATLMAENNAIDNIVFCGGFLKKNKIAQKILSLMSMVKNKKAIFMKNSEFSAAIGALFL
jgi:pantothenate kinase